MGVECFKCEDQKYIVGNCCNGHMCGCMGQPVTITNCKNCNPNDDQEMGDDLKDYENLHCLEFI